MADLPRTPGGPATATDALVLASLVERRVGDGYTVVRAPHKPDFWFGNCMVLEREPAPAEYGRWLAVHAREFADLPVRRRVNVWETAERAELAVYAGPIEREACTVFVAPPPPAAHVAPEANIRELISVLDWDRALEIVRDAEHLNDDVAAVDFAVWRLRFCQRDAEIGRCRVWGAFCADSLMAFAGL